MDTTGDSEALFQIRPGNYQYERKTLGTCRGLSVLGTQNCIQQKQLGGPVPDPLGIAESVGDGREGVDKDVIDGAGVGNAL